MNTLNLSNSIESGSQALSFQPVGFRRMFRLEGLKVKFRTAWAQDSGSGDLADVAKAAIAGRVETQLVEADRVISGIVDRSSGAVRPADSAHWYVDDMLDDLAELVLTKGGEVVVVPGEQMPTTSGLVAIYRF